MTENENMNGNEKQRSLEDLAAELDQQQKEAAQNSKFRQIQDGKTAILTFTGRVFQREAQINNSPVVKLDFELTEKTPNGINKVFSVSAKSVTARSLVHLLKAGKKVLSISRQGEGTSTRYTVSEVEQ